MKVYCRHPFNTSAQVRVTKPCGPGHEGAKDLNFVNMPYGTPVYAMESGHVAEIRRGLPPSSNPVDLPNNVVIRGSDEFYTEYAHITPVVKAPIHTHFPHGSLMWWVAYDHAQPLAIGTYIRKGDLIGYVDNSGHTIGDPHVHINRYTPGEAATLHSRPSPCDWTIKGVDTTYTPLDCIPSAVHLDPHIIPHRMNYYIPNYQMGTLMTIQPMIGYQPRPESFPSTVSGIITPTPWWSPISSIITPTPPHPIPCPNPPCNSITHPVVNFLQPQFPIIYGGRYY